jgi:hypothetical protein
LMLFFSATAILILQSEQLDDPAQVHTFHLAT